MNTKKIPALLMLLGCAVAVICTYINGYTLYETVKVLFIVLVLFLILGYIVKIIFDKNIPVITESEEPEVDDEGSVIEKTGEEEYDEDEEGFVVSEGNTME